MRHRSYLSSDLVSFCEYLVLRLSFAILTNLRASRHYPFFREHFSSSTTIELPLFLLNLDGATDSSSTPLKYFKYLSVNF